MISIAPCWPRLFLVGALVSTPAHAYGDVSSTSSSTETGGSSTSDPSTTSMTTTAKPRNCFSNVYASDHEFTWKYTDSSDATQKTINAKCSEFSPSVSGSDYGSGDAPNCDYWQLNAMPGQAVVAGADHSANAVCPQCQRCKPKEEVKCDEKGEFIDEKAEFGMMRGEGIKSKSVPKIPCPI